MCKKSLDIYLKILFIWQQHKSRHHFVLKNKTYVCTIIKVLFIKDFFRILLHTGISVRQTQAKLSFDGIKFKKPSLAQRLEKPICSLQEAKVIRSRWIAKYPWNAIFSIHQHFSRILMKKQILQHYIGFCHVPVLLSWLLLFLFVYLCVFISGVSTLKIASSLA